MSTKIFQGSNLDKVELSNRPTLYITAKLQNQIDFLHKSSPNTEWSGELICSQEGVITDLDNWKVTAEDIYLADIGSTAFTGYEVDKGAFKAPDIINMYKTFPGLKTGQLKNHHIHTH